MTLRSVGNAEPKHVRVALAAGAASLVLICTALTYDDSVLHWQRAYLLWAGFAFGSIASAYCGLGLAVFRRKEGRMDPFALFALFPALCSLWVWHAWRRQQFSPTTHVLGNVYIGGFFSKEKQWTAVLDLTSEYPVPSIDVTQAAYFNIPCLDNVDVPDYALREGVRFIDSHCKAGPVLVHCAIGRFRSARMVVSWLQHSHGYSEREAWQLLKRLRPHVNPPINM
ncbi:MAG: dual specificity protein phosphatase [Agitococcus sp.]|nr:dual specificity protein phosphatase [Agitococcus sp.]